MPMLHDLDQSHNSFQKCSESGLSDIVMRKPSEESIRTEFCDGPLFEESTAGPAPPLEEDESLYRLERRETSDRAELIERIKRGENPNWVPNRKLEDFLDLPQKPQIQDLTAGPQDVSPLLPAFELSHRLKTPSTDTNPPLAAHESRSSPPSDIKRPRSALHAGDFTADVGNSERVDQSSQWEQDTPRSSAQILLGTSPTAPWYTSTPLGPSAFQLDARFLPPYRSSTEPGERPYRSRAPSLQSYSSSFVLKPPTSPLVQQSNNNDLDFSPIDLSQNLDKTNRRHTLPPQGISTLTSLPNGRSPNSSQFARQPASFRREGIFPYQTHQARRSLTSNWSLQTSTSPQTSAYLRSRRPSFSSEASPLQHASFVGSYEESILRGRMSTGPSKPLDFTANIGALGKGDCKPKHPAHVIVPFPAVFYNWSAGFGRSPSSIDDEPSPYVGHIDLEHLLPPAQQKQRRRKQKEHLSGELDASGDTESNQDYDFSTRNLPIRKHEKRKRRSPSPRAPPGGSYRIPRIGQLQIMIQNPNKTAVKLFLVPYDLEGMEAGTKTFIRQRCFSAGPIIEAALIPGSTFESGKSSKAVEIDKKAKPTLRYLIHLNICCPSKGRFYLHQQIRVVFANRVPDNKENLQNEIQLPEPRYSLYKPSKETSAGASDAGTKSMVDKTQRRRSYGNAMDDVKTRRFTADGTFPFANVDLAPPVPPIPFGLLGSKEESRSEHSIPPYGPSDMDTSRPTSSDLQSPLSDKTNRVANTLSESYRSISSHSSDGYSKLSKGDAGYGGRPGTPEPGEGLLARRLRGFGIEKDQNKKIGEQ